MPLSFPLRSARLVLRPFTRTDVNMTHAYFQERCTSPIGHSIEDTRQHLSALLLHQHIYGFSPWAVLPHDAPTMLVGICGFFAPADIQTRPCLHASFLPDAITQGYAYEALLLCLRFGVNRLQFSAIDTSAAIYGLLPQPLPLNVHIISGSNMH